jgi:hypothetical protein
MMTNRAVMVGAALVLLAGLTARAEVKVLVDHNAQGNPDFKFKTVPGPVQGDAAEAWVNGEIKKGEARPDGWNEAVGAIIHELVHVVQQYGGNLPGKPRTPGWMTEGIADYFRWYHYEPVEHRPAFTASQAARERQTYQASYKVTGGFLDYVTRTHNHELVTVLNAALREHRWTPDLWVDYTGMTADDLWKEYAASLPPGSPGGARRGGRRGAATGTNTPALPQNLRIIPGDAPAGTNTPAPAARPAGG